MGELVSLKDIRRKTTPADSAREALTATLLGVPAITSLFSVSELVDFILIALWASGFQIVPVLPPDEAA